MPRQSRIVIPGLLHHVTQRGSRRQPVFFEEKDREIYLHLLLKYAKQNAVEIVTHCLMTNHVHLGLVPAKEDGLCKVLKPLHMRYAQIINSRMKWSGHLWQARFYSSPVDDERVESVIRYILLNPIRAKMVTEAIRYRWSNAGTLMHDPFTLCGQKWAAVLTELSAELNWLNPNQDDREIEEIRRATAHDFPIGSANFLKKLSVALKRTLEIRSVGRPAAK